MSAGTMLLTIAAILVFSGLLQRVLDRMYLTDRQALLIIGVMLLGTLFPNIPLGPLELNIGGAVIPLGVCVYVFSKADEARERFHAIFGTLITAISVYMLSKLLPSEAESMLIDPIWLYALCGGVIAWVFGRSRRNAFISSVAGVILADMITGIISLMQGYQVQIVLGGGGIADAAVISGVISVFLCEVIGESIERMVRYLQKGRTPV